MTRKNLGIVIDKPQGSSDLKMRLQINSLPVLKGVALTGKLIGQGGTSPYIFSIVGGSLPPGISMTSAGILSGTPTTVGIYPFLAKVQDAALGVFIARFSIHVHANLKNFRRNPQAGEKNWAYSYTFGITGNIGTVTWSVPVGSLPAGLALSSGGILSGTPTTVATYNFVARGTDGGSGDYLDIHCQVIIWPELKAVSPSARLFSATVVTNIETFLTNPANPTNPEFTGFQGGMPQYRYTQVLDSNGLPDLPSGLTVVYSPDKADVTVLATEAFDFITIEFYVTDALGYGPVLSRGFILRAIDPQIKIQPQLHGVDIGDPNIPNYNFTGSGVNNVTNDGTTVTVDITGGGGSSVTGDGTTIDINSSGVVSAIGVDLNDQAIPTLPADGLKLRSFDQQGFSVPHVYDANGNAIELTRDSVMVVRNNSGSTITKGSVVYQSGTTGTVPTIALAKADSQSTMPAFGVAYNSIANNAFGLVMRDGFVESINLSAYSNGDLLYVSSATAGLLTATQPATFPQVIGTVINNGVGNGVLSVNLEESPQVDWNLTAYTAKTTPVSSDIFLLADSAASNQLKKITFANLSANIPGTTYIADESTLTLNGTTSGMMFSEKNGGTTNAKLANMAAHTVKANITGSSAAPTDSSLSSIIVADSLLTTKGDLLTFDTAPARVAVGADGQIIIADSTDSQGWKWAPLGAAATSWANIVDLDFSAQSNQTLTTDTTYTIGTDTLGNNLTWTKVNSANDQTAMAVVNGSGLVIQPKNTGTWAATIKTAPAIYLDLPTYISNYYLDTPLRIWIYISTDNGANANDLTGFCHDNLSTTAATAAAFVVDRTGNSTLEYGGNLGATFSRVSVASGGTNDRVLMMAMPIGRLESAISLWASAASGGNFPLPSAMRPWHRNATASVDYTQTSDFTTGLPMKLVLFASRSASATVYSTTIARIKIDYKVL